MTEENEQLITITPAWHVRVLRRYQESWFDRYVRFSIPIALVLFLVSVFAIQPLAIDFANEAATSPVGDIILSNTPVFNVGLFFVYGMFLLVAVISFLCLHFPKRAPFVLHSLTLFVLIRSAFVSMTHVGNFTTQAASTFGPSITRVFFGADHFFSGHVGTPFLMALIFWHKPALRYLFLAWSAFFGAVVLLGHLHYTIDVFSAFFITFGIYHLALYFFPRERGLFEAAE
jgi:hypothetical protein